MGNACLGDTVAIGLIAGPEDFERIRGGVQTGRMRGLWLSGGFIPGFGHLQTHRFGVSARHGGPQSG